MSYAVIRTGGKQYRVSEGSSLRVEKLPAEVGSEVELSDVLLTSNDGKVVTDASALASASVKAKIVRHGRGRKILVFKKKRRKGYERRQGHRQDFTEIRISSLP